MAGMGNAAPGQLYSAYTQPAPPSAAAPAPAPAPSGSMTAAPTMNASVSFSGGSTDYTTAYNNALSTNQQLYNNIMAGYNQTMTYQQSQQQAINSGYSTLQADTLGQLAGVQTAQNQQAADAYAAQVGQSTQDMVNRGLGNTTVTQSVARGDMYDYQKVMNQNAANFGQLNANYMSQIGLAQLGYQDSSTQQIANTANNELQWMNTVSVPYPDPYAYAQLNQQAGAVSQGAGSYNYPPQSGYGGATGGGSSTVKNPMNPSLGNQGQYYTQPTDSAANTSSSYQYAANSAYGQPTTAYPGQAFPAASYGTDYTIQSETAPMPSGTVQVGDPWTSTMGWDDFEPTAGDW